MLIRRFVPVLALLAYAASAHATPITFTDTATASGSLGNKTFTNALVTVTLVADTSGATAGNGNLSGFQVDPGAGTVNIAGLGTFGLNSLNGVVAFASYNSLFNGNSLVGIAQYDNAAGTSLTGILGQANPTVFGYNLQSAIGPVTGTTSLSGTLPNSSFSTTGGALGFTSAPVGSVFTATGGNGTATNLPGGPVGTPVVLPNGVGQVGSTIDGVGSEDYYQFYWSGGLFNAAAAVGTTDPGDSYLFEIVTEGGGPIVSSTLNSADNFSHALSATLAPGFYLIGLQTITDPPAQPSFNITFGTPVNGVAVPEPATMTLLALGMGGLALRRRRRE